MQSGDVIHVRHQVLFSVKLLHHYFLDRKDKPYDAQTADEKVKMLAGYDARNIFKTLPTKETENVLAGNGLLFKPHILGFSVVGKGVSDGAGGFEAVPKLATGTRLRFVMMLNDPLFYQYSAPFLTKEKDRIEKAAVLGEPDKVFRKIYLLSNLVGNDAGAMAPLLSKPPLAAAPGDELTLESIRQVSGSVRQVKERQGGLGLAQWEVISQSRFLNESDLVEVELTPELPPAVFAIIDIVQEDTIANAAYRLFKPDNSLNSPAFEVRVKNRSTWWSYPNAQPAIDPAYLPLTARTVATIGGKELPNPDARTPLEQERTADNLNIKRLLSTVYQ